jgi:hypothetical protein
LGRIIPDQALYQAKAEGRDRTSVAPAAAARPGGTKRSEIEEGSRV